MEEIILPTPSIIEEAAQPLAGERRKRLRRWTLALFLTVGAGVAALLAGLALGAFSYLAALENAEKINQLGNFMIIAAFPLMMGGAHALDRLNDLKTDKNRP